VFSTGDIAKDLPTEYEDFKSIKEWYNTITKKCAKSTNISYGLFDDEIDSENMNKSTYEEIRKINEGLDKILKSLDNFVFIKRYNFPRLFFLSNNELLMIFAKSKQ